MPTKHGTTRSVEWNELSQLWNELSRERNELSDPYPHIYLVSHYWFLLLSSLNR